MSRMYWVVRGTGTPKDKDEFDKSETGECDGWACDLDMMRLIDENFASVMVECVTCIIIIIMNQQSES